jgi:hypothetical protein
MTLLLDVQNLTVTFRTQSGEVAAVLAKSSPVFPQTHLSASNHRSAMLKAADSLTNAGFAGVCA